MQTEDNAQSAKIRIADCNLINISECSLSYYALQGHQRIAQGNALGINVKAIYALKGQKRHSICQMNQKKEKNLLYKTILL